MRHPFDGIVLPETRTEQAEAATRRQALEQMLAATAGFLGLHAAARAQQATTLAIGEEGGVTTNRLGEEGGMTKALNEAGITSQAKNEEAGVVPLPPQSVDLKAEQLKAAWTDLANTDPAKGYQAVVTLVSGKQTVPFLKDNLKAETVKVDPQMAGQFIKDLDSDAFANREKATTELVKLGPAAIVLLEKEQQNAKSVEVRMRAGLVLEKIKALPAVLQVQRALDVLVVVNTPDAKKLLESLAKGDADAWLTSLAKTALGRMPK